MTRIVLCPFVPLIYAFQESERWEWEEVIVANKRMLFTFLFALEFTNYSYEGRSFLRTERHGRASKIPVELLSVLPTRQIDKRKLRERNRGTNKGKYGEKKTINRET
jgi:hypothetical protein